MTDTTDTAPPKFSQTYDLFILAGKKRFFIRSDDRGVTLTDWRLSWNAGGQDDSAPLQNIAQVRLMAGGDFKNPLNQCQITFLDGHMLTVHDGTAYGVTDDAQTPVYRDFMCALHARLALAPAGTIKFARGQTAGLYMIAKIAMVVLALMFVATPLVMLVIIPKFEVLMVLLAGGGMTYGMYRMVDNNRPEDYDPRQLPEELME